MLPHGELKATGKNCQEHQLTPREIFTISEKKKEHIVNVQNMALKWNEKETKTKEILCKPEPHSIKK